MKILVTGAAGYIGSVLVPELFLANHKAMAVDNFAYDQRSLNQCCQDENFSVINADVENLDAYRSAVESADLVIPLAAIVGAPHVQSLSLPNASIAVRFSTCWTCCHQTRW